jgi:benzoyl-CoA reductase subunit B
MTIITRSKAKPAEIIKDASMTKQKEMMNGHYERLANAPERGEKVAATFVPGNLNELLMCFDFANNLPEVNAIQNGLRKTSGGFVMEAEKLGHSEDVCTYVKSDIGMMAKGNIGPNGRKLPDPDVLLLSYTGCFTFMKWFELLRQQYQCETIMFHTPYMADGKITKDMIQYMVKQLSQGRRRSGVGAAKRQNQAVADRRLFRRHLLHRADLWRVPRHRRRCRLLPVSA